MKPSQLIQSVTAGIALGVSAFVFYSLIRLTLWSENPVTPSYNENWFVGYTNGFMTGFTISRIITVTGANPEHYILTLQSSWKTNHP